MGRYPDMTVVSINGEDPIIPEWRKIFLLAGKDSKITQHECLYEGKSAFAKLQDHVIVCQITEDGQRKEGDTFKNIENTPLFEHFSPLQSRESLLVTEKIWRFMSFIKFKDLICSRTLHYARLDQFIDRLEGVSPLSSIRAILSDERLIDEQKHETIRLYQIRMENNRKTSFACCWHINENVNKDLWNVYLDDFSESIAIQTKISKLDKITQESVFPILNEPVRYFDEPYYNQSAYWFPTLFKRSSFKYESEFRSILFGYGCELPGLKVPIEPDKLIEGIYVHPKASIEFYNQICVMVEENGLKIPIIQVDNHL